MPNTSGTYDFQSIEIEKIITEAYRNIGLAREFLTPEHLDSANMSMNLLLLDFENRSNNLWTLEYAYLALTPYTNQYSLPNTISKIIQVNLRTYTRQLNGTPASSAGGIAANAFDGDPNTACTQNAPNGNISYDFGLLNAQLTGVTQQINFVGIQSNVTRTYSIAVEYSLDAITWNVVPLFTISQEFLVGDIVWFDIPVPVDARAYRIRETGGATLDIQELYFNNNTNDFPLANISRWEDFTRPQKKQPSRPTTYYFNRQISPLISILPVPLPQYNCLQYSYVKKMQDIGNFYTNAVQIPSHFYPSLIFGLSYYLALKYDLEKADRLQALYEKSFTYASIDDSETIPLTLEINYDGDGGAISY